MIPRHTLLVLLLFTVVLTGTVFADEFKITSYYPSPYGSYRDLEAKKSLAVGNISTSGIGTVGALAQGEIWVEDSVIFKGRNVDPPVDPNKEGELIYNSLESTLKFYNGSSWARVRSTCYVSYTGSCLAGYSNMGTAGNWGYCRRWDTWNSVWDYMFRPLGVTSCPAGYAWWSSSGAAIICCQ